MAIEAARGCGFRKVGGLYLVGGELAAPCDRLPFALDVCPCCGAGIKYTRGWTWIDPVRLFDGDHESLCDCGPGCPVCWPSIHFDQESDEPRAGQAGLLWIGEKFYSTPLDFLTEGMAQGISRRISTIPHHFKIGVTWVFFAHIKAAIAQVRDEDGLFKVYSDFVPGIFAAFKPRRIERIVLQSEFETWKRGDDLLSNPEQMGDATLDEIFTPADTEVFSRLQSDVYRGVTLVPVPDDDKDHNPGN
jgi:hypothetical protein